MLYNTILHYIIISITDRHCAVYSNIWFISLFFSLKVCQPHGGRLSIGPCEAASQTSLDSLRCSDKEETECRLSAGAGGDFVNEDQGHVDFMKEGQGHTDSVKEHQRNTDLVKEGQGCSDFVKGGQGHTDIVKEGEGHTDFAKAGRDHTECMKKSHRRTNVLLAKTVLADLVTPEGAAPLPLNVRSAPADGSTNTRKYRGQSVRWKTGRGQRAEKKGRSEGRGGTEEEPSDLDLGDEAVDGLEKSQWPGQQEQVTLTVVAVCMVWSVFSSFFYSFFLLTNAMYGERKIKNNDN